MGPLVKWTKGVLAATSAKATTGRWRLCDSLAGFLLEIMP